MLDRCGKAVLTDQTEASGDFEVALGVAQRQWLISTIQVA